MNAVTRNERPLIPAPWYLQRWPWLLIAGPLLVVLGCSATIWLAFSRQDALVVGDYYEQGKAINVDLRRDRAAAAMGLAMDMRYDPASERLSGAVRSFGAPLTGSIIIALAHATQPHKDVQLVAVLDQAGRFDIALPMLETSRWQVQVEGARRDWKLAAVWKWPAEKSIAIRADVQPAD